MAMTVAVTRNLPERFHGFLASCMLEVAPGVYVAPSMRKAIRERLWDVMLGWATLVPADGGIALFWKSKTAPSGLGLRMIGWPKKELVEHEGVWLTMRALTQAHDHDELEGLLEGAED
ncbi:type I-E CRISPR-associated endoribonuclease Cas2e [Bradymonas sediminis]|uniref:Type I-E CRISPR-associated endoribonuclease Cas2 n=1 Tax=Bradymonas sediminis TaxID=1548548 RepID=A0A2Z4FHM6_9DELT|nr:type I-E CRISPR-associated endoribonuclease Cas2e [Bradymonas sediminis]AWV88254.1 type I-E CRISPR-associated endoribonuclease Cas2 [Bradymonas sediminis]TDP77378.1 CRISPR-associated Cas2 family protein [Bradymonas sediminis]